MFGGDPQWAGWSSLAMKRAEVRGPLFVNIMVVAELHAQPAVSVNLLQWLTGLSIVVEQIDHSVAARAGRAHGDYRARGGERSSILADFLIGAHATVRGLPLITRDRQRFAGYFPELTIISPETQP